MILSDADIVFSRDIGQLDISPWHDELLQPASYDLTLEPKIKRFRHGMFNRSVGHAEVEELQTWWEEESFFGNADETPWTVLGSGEFALVSTKETVTVSAALAGQVAGKSSLARQGLLVEAAGWVDPGFSGQITLELKNLTPAPIVLTAGMPICQIVFLWLRTRCNKPYGSPGLGSRYQDQRGPTEAR